MSSSVRVHEDIAWVHAEEGRVVVLDLGSPDPVPVVLESQAAVVWMALDATGGIVEDSMALVADAYGTSVSEVSPGVRSFLQDLEERGLLIVSY